MIVSMLDCWIIEMLDCGINSSRMGRSMSSLGKPVFREGVLENVRNHTNIASRDKIK